MRYSCGRKKKNYDKAGSKMDWNNRWFHLWVYDCRFYCRRIFQISRATSTVWNRMKAQKSFAYVILLIRRLSMLISISLTEDYTII